jgi:hypothetical protein
MADGRDLYVDTPNWENLASDIGRPGAWVEVVPIGTTQTVKLNGAHVSDIAQVEDVPTSRATFL